MKKGLLLTAFLTTLVLDMGVGPVLIVFGGMNLSKQTSYPSAAWLMVRGIVNCVQFVIVMLFTLIVSRTKGKYSRKEETLLIVRLLTSHPLAYFYYLLILFGIVWNILGSCWIAAAFRHYTVGFASCYLVGVILAWISVIASPFFVFSGGLFYSSYQQAPFQEPNTIQLVPYEEESISITNLLNNLHNDGIAITAEDILYRSQKPDHLNKPISLTDAEKPVLVDNIEHLPEMEERVSLMDSLVKPDTSKGVVFFQRDVLDDEKPTTDPVLQPVVLPLFQPVVEVDVVVPVDDRKEVEVMEVLHPVEVIQTLQPVEVTQTPQPVQPIESTQPSQPIEATQTFQPAPSIESAQSNESTQQEEQTKKKKTPKQKKKTRYVNPKEQVVLVDDTIAVSSISPNIPTLNLNDEFIDVSVQMQESINRGEFNHTPENSNIFSSSLAHL